MKTSLSNRLAYIGAGIGLALYAIFGLLYGSLLGGIVGMNVVHAVFGSAIDPTVISRTIVALGMLTGVLAGGTVVVLSGASLGWIAGFVLDPGTWRKGSLAEQKAKN